MKTIKLQGKDYVQVSERVRAVHADHKELDIRTEYQMLADGVVVFKAIVDLPQGIYTGHSYGKIGLQKQFEKQETIAVGRALAFAGYHADGEIASADEMQEYGNEIAQEILADAVMQIMEAKDVPDLEKVYKQLPADVRRSKEVIDSGKRRKKELTEIE